MSSQTEPDRFHFERELAQQGASFIAGVDEAGRGPLAGPVVVAAVVLPASWYQAGVPAELAGLNDSKKLTERRREAYFEILGGLTEVIQSVVCVEAAEIDERNILGATHVGMVRALAGLGRSVDHVLIDGLAVSAVTQPQTPLVKGDSRSFSIAAASVLAKVTRDRLMLEYDGLYPDYGFAQHKGYPTAAHLAALRERGASPIHRRSFAPVRAQQMELL